VHAGDVLAQLSAVELTDRRTKRVPRWRRQPQIATTSYAESCEQVDF